MLTKCLRGRAPASSELNFVADLVSRLRFVPVWRLRVHEAEYCQRESEWRQLANSNTR